ARNVARACTQVGARCIYISTDYVFDGSKPDPYSESDAPGPINAYGRSKLAGEQATAEECPHCCIVRTAWLYGRNGRNFVGTMLNAARTGQPLRVVNDQHGQQIGRAHV